MKLIPLKPELTCVVQPGQVPEKFKPPLELESRPGRTPLESRIRIRIRISGIESGSGGYSWMGGFTVSRRLDFLRRGE